MSISQLKDQVTHLPPQEQRELMAFMVSLQTERDLTFKRELAEKIDDADPTHWIELDELRKKWAE